MSEITTCTGGVRASRNHGRLFILFLTILITISVYLVTLITWGFFVALLVLTAMVGISMIATNRGQLGVVIQVLTLVVVVLINCIVPSGYLMHTKDGIVQTKEFIFVSPFTHEMPLKSSPDITGQLEVKNGLPQNWSVSVWYWVPPNAELATKDWVMFQKAVSEGIEVPSTTLYSEDGPVLHIEKYLKKQYPFMHTDVEVTHNKVEVWK